MTAEQIVDVLKERFPSQILAAFAADKHPRVHVNAADWRAIAEFVVSDPRLQLDWLANHTGIDYAANGQMAVVHDLYSFDHKHTFAIKVFAPRENPTFPTVQDLWPAANWHEREAYDLFGMIFTGHPNLTRILCADDWVGFPLRKDYVFPKEFQGIPGNPMMPWDPASHPAPAKPAAPAAKPEAKSEAKPAAPPAPPAP